MLSAIFRKQSTRAFTHLPDRRRNRVRTHHQNSTLNSSELGVFLFLSRVLPRGVGGSCGGLRTSAFEPPAPFCGLVSQFRPFLSAPGATGNTQKSARRTPWGHSDQSLTSGRIEQFILDIGSRREITTVLAAYKHNSARCSSHNNGVRDARSNSVTCSGNDSSRIAATMSGAKVVRLTIRLT